MPTHALTRTAGANEQGFAGTSVPDGIRPELTASEILARCPDGFLEHRRHVDAGTCTLRTARRRLATHEPRSRIPRQLHRERAHDAGNVRVPRQPLGEGPRAITTAVVGRTNVRLVETPARLPPTTRPRTKPNHTRSAIAAEEPDMQLPILI